MNLFRHRTERKVYFDMKKIALVLVLVMCALLMFSCGEPEARDIVDADGNVVAKGYYDGEKLLYEEKTDSNGDLEKKTTYDDEGRVAKVEEYLLGKLSSESVYTYTDNAANYSISITSFNNKGTAVLEEEIKYENDRPVSKTGTVANKGEGAAVEQTTYTYNDEDGTVVESVSSNGIKIREIMSDGNGVTIYEIKISDDGSSTKTFYDQGTLVAKKETYNAEGKLVVTIVNEYNADGILVGSKTYMADGSLKDYSVYVFEGSTLKGIYKYNANDTINCTIVYDENGKATIHDGQYVVIN